MSTQHKYHLKVLPTEYDLITQGKEDRIVYLTTDHLPKEETTFKDLPGNYANLLRNVSPGDQITFECDPRKLRTMIGPIQWKYLDELVTNVVEVEENKSKHQRTIRFQLMKTE